MRILLYFRKYDQVGTVFGNHIFSEDMPWKAPFAKVGKGASSGDAVDGCGEQTGEGGAGNLVEKVLPVTDRKPYMAPGQKLIVLNICINGWIFVRNYRRMSSVK